MKTTKRTKTICVALLLAAAAAVPCALLAQQRDVQPTEQEIEYMETLDQTLSQEFGGNDDVKASVTESDAGERTIHLDYSDSEGAVITADPVDAPEPVEPVEPPL